MYTETYDKDVHSRVWNKKKKETTLFINRKINTLWYIHSSMQLLKEQVERSRANWRLVYMYIMCDSICVKKHVRTQEKINTKTLNYGWLWKGNWNCEGICEGEDLNFLLYLSYVISIACLFWKLDSLLSPSYPLILKPILGGTLRTKSFILFYYFQFFFFWGGRLDWTQGFIRISCISIHHLYYLTYTQIILSLVTICLFKLASEFCSWYNLTAWFLLW